ncbi:MAG: hypothetical protein Q9181_005462, partial [Wetmoreana brouardii]
MPPKPQPRRQPPRDSRSSDVTKEPPEPVSPRRNASLYNERLEDTGEKHDTLKVAETGDVRSAAAGEIAADPATTPSAPPRHPVQRLASLNLGRRDLQSSAESPHLLFSDVPPKKLKFQPKSAIRRSKEEREATERAEAERLQARLAASDASKGVTPGRGAFRGGRGAVISTRWQQERYAGAGASGFLGGATPAADKKQREALSARTRGGGRSSVASRVHREATEAESTPRVKKEAGLTKRKVKDKDGDVVMSGSGSGRRTSTRVKKEQPEGLREESDDELFELEPSARKINIEHINLISDEESSDDVLSPGDKGKGRERQKTPKSIGSSFMRPIRIDRHEHIERTVGVNTDASSLTSAELRKRAKARGEAEGSLFLPEDADIMNDTTSRPKGRRKGRDVEFIKNERKWQGVYQDDEDDSRPVRIKEEPNEDNDAMVINDERPSGTAITQDMLTQDATAKQTDDALPPSTKTPPPDPQLPPKPKPKHKTKTPKALALRKPLLQTEEDRKEWQRFKEDIALLRDVLQTTALDDTEMDIDDDAETEMAKAKIRNKKEGLVYLFQLPPVLPEIQSPRSKHVSKPKPQSEEAKAPDTQNTKDKDPASTGAKVDTSSKSNRPDTAASKKPIKPDPQPSSPVPNPSATTSSSHALPPNPTQPYPPGTLGHISLSYEGFPSATWSNTLRMDLGRANDYGALQEVVLLRGETAQ